jgi:hypothetical protein
LPFQRRDFENFFYVGFRKGNQYTVGLWDFRFWRRWKFGSCVMTRCSHVACYQRLEIYFYLVDGEDRLLRNVGNYLEDYISNQQ